ncbi:MAG TPA: prepilin-type N-terminal cleavage/methylation domain-containing protein, partial [Candidatus Angelobacter sp.]|nr:prepilin-type N-terminal cleavage/methylation domain-containing protein [Candidatus Angelobacter sp.]
MPQKQNSKAATGFSLIELMVAMLIFLVIGGAAVALVKKHVPIFTSQQNQTGLNISMRNAVAQMQIDVVNAGTGYYQGVNIP